MLQLFLIFIAAALGGGTGDADAPAAEAVAPAAPVTAQASPLEAEPQVPSGKFTTAVEVKPILNMTRGNWVAVREFDGQDLLYVTHLMSWRCGLVQLRFGVNGNPLQVWPLPACHEDTAAPNALTPEDGLPYERFALGSVQKVEIELTYDDLTIESAKFERKAILMP
ncbi:hypothetical protein VK792_01560 [Mesobacterium sp. TK19101]|uniref:Uncharacterized protein n=1 Tax=Mesobacterium hydrothermale TaxID=3111907 RepID=A0ABU6HE90_9RHOB|nr:hypothetical protein [Mesobacterium sp. TK19101]MEC3859959.1 hypothetical protein [Mesobacterium sp. TK19101]